MNETTQTLIMRVADWKRPLEERIQSLSAISALEDADAVVMLAALLPDVEPGLVPAIRKALLELGGLKLLAQTLRSSDKADRAQAIRMIGFVAEPDSVAWVLRGLEDSDPDVREEAADALANLRVDAAFEPLSRVLRADPEPRVRSAAAQAIGCYPTAAARQALLDAQSRDRDPLVLSIVDLALTRCRPAPSGPQRRPPSHDDGPSALRSRKAV